MSASPLRTANVAAVAAAVALAASACGSDATEVADGAPTVVVTTSVWADVVANVACEGGVGIEVLVPAGADPHAFEPSLSDRATMDGAALIVANGLGLEEGLDDTIEAAEGAGTPVLRLGESIATIPYSFADGHSDEAEHHDKDGEDHDEHDHEGGVDEGHEDEHGEDHDEHDHEGGVDPHLWLDPVRVASVVPVVAERLAAEAGLDRAQLDECVTAYQEELAELDAEVEALVLDLPADRRKLITSHEALGYFADRYGFEVIGTVIPAPSGLAETNPAHLQELAQLIATTGVSAIFAEVQHSADDAEALAAQVGDVEVVTLFTGSLGDEGSGAETYVGLLRTNAELVTTALG